MLGVGRKTTPVPFKNACNEFIFTESLKPAKKTTKKKKATQSQQLQNMSKKDKKVIALLRKAIDISTKKQGWVNLGTLGKSIGEIDAKFSLKNQGHSRLSSLVEAYPHIIEIRKEGTAQYVRLRS